MPLLWVVHRCRLKLLPIRTGAGVEKLVLVPLLLVATVAAALPEHRAHTAPSTPWSQRVLSLG